MEPNPDFDCKVMCMLAMARECAPEARKQYLSDACGEDSDLLHEVAEVLAWEERMGSFLHRPLLQSMELARPFKAGDVVAGRFDIVRVIGEGGMGVVYEAFDRRRRLRIAIKAAKPGFQRLLSPELEGALKVRHPNVCLVNEIHTAESAYGDVEFLTMELLEGETLAAYLSKHGKFARSDALDVARQLCAGLAEAHRCGIVHRDLKAANVILCPTANGATRAVITDFGLAGGGTSGDVIGGTPGYMAPEVLGEGVTSTKLRSGAARRNPRRSRTTLLRERSNRVAWIGLSNLAGHAQSAAVSILRRQRDRQAHQTSSGCSRRDSSASKQWSQSRSRLHFCSRSPRSNHRSTTGSSTISGHSGRA
jgi:serine/threonine protein kinase